MLPNFKLWRKRAVPEIREAQRFTCPRCAGYAIGCGHCQGNGFVYCGPTLHQLDGAFDWPEFGGRYATCGNCGTTVQQVAHDSSEDGSDRLGVGHDAQNGEVVA